MDFSTSFVSYTSSSNQLQVTDASGFNPNGGIGFYNVSGTYSSFAYQSVVNNVMQGVATGPTGTPTSVDNRNGSFCHTAANSDGTIGTTRTYCDDDYTDSDGDGLANWQE